MKLRIYSCLFAACMVLACEAKQESEPAYSESVTYDLGNSIELDSIPSQIVTLAPNLTEFIFELGIQENLIGNTLNCNYPEEARNITNVGDLLTIDLEKIVTLKPD